MRTSNQRAVRRRRPPRVLLVALVLASLPLLASTCFRIPTSASAPPGLYLLTYRPPTRADWVVACLPEPLGRFGRRRGYLSGGPCPGGAAEVLKRVAALPGDRVEVTAAMLIVNGRALPRTRRKALDSAGRAIPRIPSGTYRVRAGSVWLYSGEVPTSWDSRYFGAVPLAGVRSTARRLLSTPFYANRSDSAASLVHLRPVRSDEMTFRSTHPTPQPSTSPTSGGPGATSLLSALASLLGAASFFTQRIAHELGYDAMLGRPLVLLPLPRPVLLALAGACLLLPAWALAAPHRRPVAPALLLPSGFFFALAHGPLYPPLAGFEWLPALLGTSWRGLAGTASVQATAVLAGGLIVTAVLHRSHAPRGRQIAAVAHGSARFATDADLIAADLLSGEGLVLGSIPRRGRRRTLTDRSGQHALLVMPPGAGKTTGPIASSLLNTPDHSALVLDPKGELFELTAGWRQEQGQRVVRFAPHSGATERWNPVDEIPRGEREVAALAALAENLVSYPAEVQADSHWTAAARSLLRCLLLHELYRHDRPSLLTARNLLASRPGSDGLDKLFAELADAIHDPDERYGWRGENGNLTQTHPEVGRLARSFGATPPRERGSIVSTLGRFLDLWGDPRIAAATETSDWNLSVLTDPEVPATVYVTAPFNELARLAPLLRILVALLVHRLTDDSTPYRDVATGGRRRVLLVLDEFATLGRLPLLEEVLAFLRGYGVTSLLAVQDLGQLYRLYTRNETFSGTCGVHVAAASANLTTRGEFSRRAGEATAVYAKRARTGTTFSRRITHSQAEVRRPLLTEGEIGSLPPDRLLIIKAGHPAILARKLPYWQHHVLARRAAVPAPRRPLASTDTSRHGGPGVTRPPRPLALQPSIPADTGRNDLERSR